ncbi:DNA-directed RNA polymerase specialized sigma subunit, sigma24 family [Thermomonospora echinospora]|uniref:DNA-directed RNA polymerase specialized sigma subunit, sigma24 family n=1 Tax=Thermomonospora echinospora TaxID=1992 RepID=A0A1H5YUF1_9ACTN|nr:sigma-70 family RNA polymerase sigma factor [Thermomonospora echinospora]SEG27614.1 DNA-directed RNA polymerase specialized sigma subunit, sigma24 family [Thermomonospora echinospora]
MDDHTLVKALGSREPGAPAALCDAYAPRLYDYCWFRLHDHDAAEAALRETFAAARTRIGGLRDAGRLGPWLYATARLECDRRETGDGMPPVPPVAAHDQADVDQRILAWRAVRGMPPLSREVLDLWVRHRLPVPDLGAVLDLPVRDARRVLARANADLQEAVTAELLAEEGPYDCPGRAAILRERQGELTAPMRRLLVWHAQECTTCGPFRRRAVSPVKVYGLLPEAEPPASLHARMLVSFEDPKDPKDLKDPKQARRAVGLDVRHPLPERQGPDEAAADDGADRTGRRVALITAAGACLVLLAATLSSVLHGDDRAVGGQAVPAAPPQPLAVPDHKLPGKWAVDSLPASPTWPLGARRSSAPPTARPTPPAERGHKPGTPERPDRPEGGSGALAVSPRYLDLGGRLYGAVELLAEGGPVDWQAHTSGRVRLGRTSGRLYAGRPVLLWLTVTRRPGSSGQGAITFQPSGIQVVVTWRPGPAGEPRPVPVPPGPSAPGRPPERAPSLPPGRPDRDPDAPYSEPYSAPPEPPTQQPPPDPAPSDPPEPGPSEPPPSSGPDPEAEPPQT